MIPKSKNEKANDFKNSKEIIALIHHYEALSKHKDKKPIGYTGKQGELLKKFKDTEDFFDNVGQSRSTIYFKISFCKFLMKC